MNQNYREEAIYHPMKQNYFQQRSFGREIQNFPSQALSPRKIQVRNSTILQSCKTNMSVEPINTEIDNFYKKELNNTGSTFPNSSSTMDEERLSADFIDSPILLKQEKFQKNPQLVGSYAEEIFQYLVENESDSLAVPHYMENFQFDINPRMRTILIDWLIEVHLKFKLLPQTLFLTVNLLDRYLAMNRILRSELQLVGVTALFIAAKYEEIYAPELKDFVYICDKAYTKQEILNMEGQILYCVQFNLTYTGPLRFLERYVQIINEEENNLGIFESELFYTGQYLIELSLHVYEMLQFKPSLLAASALYLAQKILNLQTDFPSEYTEQQIIKCSRSLELIYSTSSQYRAVKRKFGHEKFHSVSETDKVQ